VAVIKIEIVMKNLKLMKEEFIALLKETGREGVDYVIEDLEDLGFFEAPASSAFHLNRDGGLVEHSLNVCRVALKLRESMVGMDGSLAMELPKDSIIIASLLHDACKADIYKPVIKKHKNKYGVWEDKPGYDVDYSNFPLGHGEKSVIMLLRSGLDMTDEEIMAIRWHMNAWEIPFQSFDSKSNYNAAKCKSPLVSLIQAADNLAATLLERE
jgi:hypothetical protein